MTDTPPLAKGGTSRQATTTVVGLHAPGIDPADKKVLCSALCQCDKTPNIAKDGKQLKQACVAERMKALDTLLAHRSPYKQEINYDMTKTPPAPIMDGGVATRGHQWIPGWIKKRYGTDPVYPPQYKTGTGLIRRPDVVIVKDPAKPPTQDNIKQIVEMKFPPDKISPPQKAAYEEIAGDDKKLKKLEPSDCDCDKPEPDAPEIPTEALGPLGAAAAWAFYIFSRGRSPRPPTPAF